MRRRAPISGQAAYVAAGKCPLPAVGEWYRNELRFCAAHRAMALRLATSDKRKNIFKSLKAAPTIVHCILPCRARSNKCDVRIGGRPAIRRQAFHLSRTPCPPGGPTARSTKGVAHGRSSIPSRTWPRKPRNWSVPRCPRSEFGVARGHEPSSAGSACAQKIIVTRESEPEQRIIGWSNDRVLGI